MLRVMMLVLVLPFLVGCPGVQLTPEEEARAKALGAQVADMEAKVKATIAAIAAMKESGEIDPAMLIQLASEAEGYAVKISAVKDEIAQIIKTAEERGGFWAGLLGILKTVIIAAGTYLGTRQARLAAGKYIVNPKPTIT